MDTGRLMATLDKLAACTATPGRGVTRFSWTGEDRAAREVLERELRAIGLEPWTDGIGNLHARLRGRSDAPAVFTGSHLDSVRNGGRLDGAYGTVAALEALRSFHNEGYVPWRAVEFIAFAEEEGSNFGTTCLGSKALTGEVGPADLQSMVDIGGSAYARIAAFGLDPATLPGQRLDPAAVHAYLELHIEQGPRLERANVPLGIVTAISGMGTFLITLHGRSDHAAAPMRGRLDPVVGFADFVRRAEDLWRDGVLPSDFSFTVGTVSCTPGVRIAIADTLTFTLDVRQADVTLLDRGLERLLTLARGVAAERGLRIEMSRLSASGGVSMSPGVGEVLRRACESRGVSPMSLVSGPAHDAASMARVVPAGLLFVPSVGGLSHCPQETTSDEHLALGALVLEDALRLLASDSPLPSPSCPSPDGAFTTGGSAAQTILEDV